MESAVGLAVIDGQARPELLDAIDTLHVVNTLTWSYSDAPRQLAERLGLHPKRFTYGAIGGNSPQALVNRVARDLERGVVRCALLVGAEAGASAKRAAIEAVDLGWPVRARPEYVDGDERLGFSSLELDYGLALPVHMYPLIETALRWSAGRSPNAHHAHLGQLCARMSSVAARHPQAWFRAACTPEQVMAVGPDNRWVGYPYTKRMCAVLEVDQGAALVMTTEATAAELGIDSSRWVYPLAGVDLNDVWHVTERPRLEESPAIRRAVRLTLEHAGVSLGEVGGFDLYSCFPCAVEIARAMIGLSDEDPRPITVTGGLPYFGGPGNNYSMHAIATVVERIRGGELANALVTALGWYATKHAVGLYGNSPPTRRWNDLDASPWQAEIDRQALPSLEREASGPFTIEAFVIRHDRDGAAHDGVCLGRLGSGRRALALIDAGRAELEALEREELVGRVGSCRHDLATERNRLRLG
jgi:acetyl-CoA C-acetyltransferase